MTTRVSVTIASPSDRQKVARWAADTENGTVVTFRKKSRSTEQSAKMWAMLHEVSEQVEWYGQKIDAEDWKDMFTASLRHARVVPGIDKGTFVPLGMRTSTMTIEEMTNLIELIYAFGAQHNVIFKDPKQSSSDETALSQSVDAGMKPAEGEVENPPAASPSNDPERDILIRFAAEMLPMAANINVSPSTLKEVEKGWSEGEMKSLTADGKEKARSISMSIRAIANGKASLESAIEFYSEMLGCKPSDLGGVDG